MKLESPACTNKGFILDGFPKTFEGCLQVFGDKITFPVDAEGNEERGAYQESKESIGGFNLRAALLPQYSVSLSAEDEFLRTKLKELPEEQKQANQADDQMVRRLKAFREHNQPDSDRRVEVFV